jgi:hypothetical protein
MVGRSGEVQLEMWDVLGISLIGMLQSEYETEENY